MVIKILGAGCANCKKLEKNAKKAVEELGIEAEIEKVEDMGEILSYGVMNTPTLVIDEDVKIVGRVASPEDIKEYLK